MAGNRRARVDEEVKRALSDIIAHDVKDDRLSPIASVTAVEVTPDLKYAKVYMSVYGTDADKARTMDGLRHAARFIRSRLAKKVALRRSPELSFVLDNSVTHGLHIAELLDGIHASQPAEDGAASAQESVAADADR